jgi:hypothetical protein
LLEAKDLHDELAALEGSSDIQGFLDRRFPEIDEHSLYILDVMDDPYQWLFNDWTRPVSAIPIFFALPEAIADFVERRSREKAVARERGLRLIGIPHPTINDFLENEEVANVLSAGFALAGIINHFGVRHARRDNLDLAIRYFTAAIKVCPVHSEPQINRGKAYLQIGEQEKGLQDYEMALPLSGGDPEVEAILKQHKRGPWRS